MQIDMPAAFASAHHRPADVVVGNAEALHIDPVDPAGIGFERDGKPAVEPCRLDLDIAQPSVTKIGGVSEMMKIASMAELYGVAFNPHNPNGNYISPSYTPTDPR